MEATVATPRAPWWWYVGVTPVLLVLGALAHELAHALAVVAQGGTVMELDLIPAWRGGGPSFSQLVFGRVPLQRLVWIAPTVLWIAVAGTTAILILARRVRRPRLAEMLLFGLVVLPLVDVCFSFAGLLVGWRSADLSRAFRGYEPLGWLIMGAVLVGFGWLVRRCWVHTRRRSA